MPTSAPLTGGGTAARTVRFSPQERRASPRQVVMTKACRISCDTIVRFRLKQPKTVRSLSIGGAEWHTTLDESVGSELRSDFERLALDDRCRYPGGGTVLPPRGQEDPRAPRRDLWILSFGAHRRAGFSHALADGSGCGGERPRFRRDPHRLDAAGGGVRL